MSPGNSRRHSRRFPSPCSALLARINLKFQIARGTEDVHMLFGMYTLWFPLKVELKFCRGRTEKARTLLCLARRRRGRLRHRVRLCSRQPGEDLRQLPHRSERREGGGGESYSILQQQWARAELEQHVRVFWNEVPCQNYCMVRLTQQFWCWI